MCGALLHFEPSHCTGCGLCVERCQFGAWNWDDGDVELNTESFFDCGLCVSTCSAGAISLGER